MRKIPGPCIRSVHPTSRRIPMALMAPILGGLSPVRMLAQPFAGCEAELIVPFGTEAAR